MTSTAYRVWRWVFGRPIPAVRIFPNPNYQEFEFEWEARPKTVEDYRIDRQPFEPSVRSRRQYLRTTLGDGVSRSFCPWPKTSTYWQAIWNRKHSGCQRNKGRLWPRSVDRALQWSYHLPESTTQLNKVSTLLLAIDSGKITQNRGNNFDTIDLAEKSVATRVSPSSFSSAVYIISISSRYFEHSGGRWSYRYKWRYSTEWVRTYRGNGKLVTVKMDAVSRQIAAFWIRRKYPRKMRREPDLRSRTWV